MDKKQIEEMRKVMGTLPNQTPTLQTKFLKGVEGITVELIDRNVNPYKAMYVLGTSCWGKKINKWKETTPEARFEVVKAILQRQALPLALEAPSFTFAIEGLSRAAFDQLARARLGVVFSAKGMRDNNWADCNIRIPNELWPENDGDSQIFAFLKGVHEHTKGMYQTIVEQGKGSWQTARSVLPLYVEYGFSMAINFAALQNMCANRMKFCEMEDTVAVAWLLAKRISEELPLLGSYLKPGCDNAGVCQYHRSYYLSEMFGCLFSECGRNECMNTDGYAEFNKSCTDAKLLGEQLGIDIPGPKEWPVFDTFESLSYYDKELFLDRY